MPWVVPCGWTLTGGNIADIDQAATLLEGHCAEYVLADKGYDANALIELVRDQGVVPVIPPRSNRLEQRSYDRHVYKDCNLIERFFNRIKQFRQIATRHEKLARNFNSMLAIVCTFIWIQQLLTRPRVRSRATQAFNVLSTGLRSRLFQRLFLP